MAYMRAFSMPVALKNRPRPMGKLPKLGTHATRMQHKKCPLCNTIPTPQDSQHTQSPGDRCTRFRPPREKKRVSEPKNGSDTRFFRLFSSNLIGNFLAHHMYFPGRSLFRLFYYFKSLFSLRKTEYEKPRDIIRPGSVLIGHGTIGIGQPLRRQTATAGDITPPSGQNHSGSGFHSA